MRWRERALALVVQESLEKQPPGQRIGDKVHYARELLALYGDAREARTYAQYLPH